jgi:hypothetical protein
LFLNLTTFSQKEAELSSSTSQMLV